MSSNEEISLKISPQEEYKEVGLLLRFFSGVRFSLLASFATFFVILMSAYNYVWTSKDVFIDLQKYLLLLISLFGLFITITAWLIEYRTIILYQICLRRGRELEQQHGALYDLLIPSSSQVRVFWIPATHTAAIQALYCIIFGIWSLLVYYGLFNIFYFK